MFLSDELLQAIDAIFSDRAKAGNVNTKWGAQMSMELVHLWDRHLANAYDVHPASISTELAAMSAMLCAITAHVSADDSAEARANVRNKLAQTMLRTFKSVSEAVDGGLSMAEIVNQIGIILDRSFHAKTLVRPAPN